MDAKIFFITLAVDDLNRSLAFYRDGLGWPTEGIVCRQLSPGPAAGTADAGLATAAGADSSKPASPNITIRARNLIKLAGWYIAHLPQR